MTRGSAAAFVLRGGGMALAAVSAVVIARELGAGAYGAYAWAIAWVSALAVPAALGADQLMVREAAVARDRGEWSRVRRLFGSTLRWCAAGAIGATAVAAVVLALAGGGLGVRRTALLVALPIVPLAALASVAQGALLGMGRMAAALAPPTAGRQAVFLVLVTVAAAVGVLSAADAVAIQLVASAIAAAVALVFAWRAFPAATAPSHPVSAREWLPLSVPMGAALMLLMLDAQVGLLIVGALGAISETGVYAAAVQCMAPFVLVATAVRLPLAPAAARLGAAGDRDLLQTTLRQATRGVAAVSAVAAAVLIVVPEQVLRLFGDDFRSGSAALRFLAIAYLVNALCAFNGTVLLMNGHERATMRSAFAALLLDAVLCVALVPSLGATGAAIAALVSITARNVVNSVMVWRRLGIDATFVGRLPGPTRR